MARIKIGLSKQELATFREIALGKSRLAELAMALGKSRRQLSRILRNLDKAGFIETKGREIIFQKHAFIPILVQTLRVHSHLVDLLAGSGMIIFKELLEPKSIAELEVKTGLKIAIIHRKIMRAKAVSMVRKEGKNYLFNGKIWPELKEFLENYKQYALRIAPKIDADVLIRGKYGNEIVAESPKEILNASLTAFSLYSNYGIGILAPTNYYHFPKKRLGIQQVFYDSLVILEDDPEYRKTLYAILFYLKNKSKLKSFKHKLIDNLKRVLKGEKIRGFPSLNDIMEKAEQYDIKI